MKIPRPKATSWKNGQGSTREIAIEPPSSHFPRDPFLWRISNAEVTSSNSFSRFPGYDRLLIVWSGVGLILNEIHLKPFTPFEFSGDDVFDCKPIRGSVEDLGVIYQRGKVSPLVQIISIEKNELNLNLKAGMHFIFCAQGAVELKDTRLETGETFFISEQQSQIKIVPLKSAILIVVTLR